VGVAHVVLFDLRPDLGEDGARRFRAALAHALDAIPSVRRVTLGRRVPPGAGYDAGPSGFTFYAAIEFDDAQGLRVYLEHPAHAELGSLFWASTARSLVLDFELAGNDRLRSIAEWT
jgi:hypothetical protein